MKKSYYNFTFPKEDGSYILYNSRTGAMAEIDKEHAEQLEKLSEQELEEQNSDFANALIENGFAVEDDVSELDMIQYDSLRTRFGNTNLSLTITPTMNCNFGCKYCYEKDVLRNQYMSEDTQKAIVRYVAEKAPSVNKMSVCWYGGEPLMAVDIIQKLTKEFMRICKEYNIEYNAEIVTNGYLLTKDVVTQLLLCQITQYQITLDGTEEVHNKRRPLQNGMPTYQKIWDNLLVLKEFEDKVKIALRVNIDKENKSALYEVEEQIKKQGMDSFVYVYPGKVMAVGGCYKKEACFNNKEFAELEQEFQCEHPERVSFQYPKPIHNVCGADNENAIVITENGDLYRCWMDIGCNEFCVGNINDDERRNESILYEYMLHDATQNETCARCKYLPLCLGGCPHKRINHMEHCTLLKHSLERYMRYIPQVVGE